MKNSEYWEGRIAEDTWTKYNSLEERNRQLLEMYRGAIDDISQELYKITEKINGGKAITLSDMHKFKRLENLQEKFENIVLDLGKNVEKFGKNNMIEGGKEVYKNVRTSLGNIDFSLPNKKLMNEMLDRPWLGDSFSGRLWKNNKVLAMNLNDLLVRGLTQGKTISEISIDLSNRMNVEFNNAHRLVRTETMHYLNESAFKGYKDAGCEEVELWAAKDERTCKVCGAKHSKVYSIDERPILPLHANCRCTYLPVIKKKEVKENNWENNKWEDFKYENKVFKNKKEIKSYLEDNYGFKVSDSKKYPIDKDIMQNCTNWLDKFHGCFKGFKDVDPVLLPNFKIKASMKAVGYYRYYTNKPEALELALNGIYFTDKGFNKEYVEHSIKTKWTVPNAQEHKTFVHEYGHHIANSLRWLESDGDDKWCDNFIDEVIKDYNKEYNKDVSFKDAPELVSRYGATTKAEAFAETFAEYFGGDNPRDFAKVFGKKVEKLLNKYIKKG